MKIRRRAFFQSAGILFALPVLESAPMANAKKSDRHELGRPARMIGICNNLGILPNHFFPETAGKDYELSEYLKKLSSFKNKFTVLSGVSHPGVDGSHASDVSFLTAAPHPGSGGFRNSVSLDQYIASKIGHQTRFPSFTLGVNAKPGRRSLSWTSGGVLIPCENKASEIYKKLFISGSKDEVRNQIHRLKLGQSIMDSLSEQSKNILKKVSIRDRDKLDQYMTSVREVEKRLLQAEEWEKKPKPQTSEPLPKDPSNPNQYMEKTRLMYKMAKLAFETDSTRSISLLLDSTNSPAIKVEGTKITDGYHNLSHHGRNESKLSQLKAIDNLHMTLLNEFLTDLHSTSEQDSNLLDQSLVFYGSNLGDANKHTTENMPALIAGGRLKHAGHLSFDKNNNYPLTNLFVTMLQAMGINEEKFATSTGAMKGLSIA